MAETQHATFNIKTKYIIKLLQEACAIVDAPHLTHTDLMNVELRLNEITTSYSVCTELYEKLSAVEVDETLEGDWNRIRNTYYKLAAKIKEIRERVQSKKDVATTALGPMGNSTFFEKQKLLKLPFVALPKFSGDHEKWLSYKNAFLNMIDSRTDIDDVVKLTYLRNTLEGEALNKVTLYDVSSENYSKAWQTLIDSYERKRILISKHLDAIFDIVPLTSVLSKDLSKLIDEAKQHLNTLESLGVEVPDRVSVRLLERALPSLVRQKWEESLTLDELPSMKQFYKFIQETAARSFTMETDNRVGNSENVTMISREKHAAKLRKSNDGTRVLVTSVESACVLCKQAHLLYRCPQFLKLAVQKRWDFIKAKKLCYNCMRAHQGKCELGSCKFCPKRHNSLLHSEAKLSAINQDSDAATNSHSQKTPNNTL